MIDVVFEKVIPYDLGMAGGEQQKGRSIERMLRPVKVG
jgi:hypothetical protein